MRDMEEDKGRGIRRPVDHMRHHRENGWDYRGRAIYHFTLPVEERYPLFGVLDGESPETAFVRLNPFGRRVCQMLCGLAQFYEGKGYALKVLAQKVMPYHVHLVIQVLAPLPQSIGTVVRGFKSGCTKVYKEMYGSGENATGMDGKERANGTGVDAPAHFARIFERRGSVWQQDAAYYHERILHAPGQLRRMIDYVTDNPRRLWIKSRHPELFRLHRRTEVAGLSFTSVGNHFRLDWPDRQVVENRETRLKRRCRNSSRRYWRQRKMGLSHIPRPSVRASNSSPALCVRRAIRWWCCSTTVSRRKGRHMSVTTNRGACISRRAQEDSCCCWNRTSSRFLMLTSRRLLKRRCAVRQRPGITPIPPSL